MCILDLMYESLSLVASYLKCNLYKMIKSLRTSKTNISGHVYIYIRTYIYLLKVSVYDVGILYLSICTYSIIALDFRIIISVYTGVFNHGNVPGICMYVRIYVYIYICISISNPNNVLSKKRRACGVNDYHILMCS